MPTKTCTVRKYGIFPYADAWEMQKQLVQSIQKGEATDALILLEHPPVFTIGKSGKDANLLIDKNVLDKVGAEVFHVDRGGDITYHGPGQLVGYPIMNLRKYKCDIKWYINRIEEVLIRTVAHYGIEAGRIKGLTGVWVGDNKIAAIGARISKWITSHGFALNVNTDLDYFRLIVPCGIRDKGVTSMSKILGNSVDIEDVKDRVTAEFGETFGCKMTQESLLVKDEGKDR